MIALTEQERRLLDIIRPIADGLRMEIVRVRVTGGRRPHLQVMAERTGGAPTDVEDCARLSRAMGPVLEEADPISEAYILEVSTPGIDRPLTRPGDFGRWIGHAARVELARPIDGRRRFTGTIVSEGDDGVHIELDDETELVAAVHEMSRAPPIDFGRIAAQSAKQVIVQKVREAERDRSTTNTRTASARSSTAPSSASNTATSSSISAAAKASSAATS
jgi:ribosome maturation factor RimP